MMDMDEQAVCRLVDAVVKKAVQDWRNAKRMLRKHPDSFVHTSTVLDCERFFLSGYFTMLTDMDGRAFLDKLLEEWELEKRHTRKNGKGKGCA